MKALNFLLCYLLTQDVYPYRKFREIFLANNLDEIYEANIQKEIVMNNFHLALHLELCLLLQMHN